MLNQIIAFSLRNRLLIVLVSTLLLGVGIFTALKMEVDVFPDLNAPTVAIMTEARGMAAEEVERLVTFPIETAVNGAAKVRRVRSTSSTGFSVVYVEFDWGTDVYRARQIVSEKLTAVASLLPVEAGGPTLAPQSSILGEVLFIGLSADSTSLGELRTLADRTIRPLLLATGGVAQVSVIGGDVGEFQIRIHPERMRHYGVTLNEVLSATREMNRNASGGIHYEYGNEYIVRGMLSTSDVHELEKAVIKLSQRGEPIVLADIADVELGSKTPKTGVASVNAKPAVLLTVSKQPDTGTIDLTKKLEEAIRSLTPSLPPDVSVHLDLYRQQNFIDASISNIQKALVEGALFVVVILLVFLMNARTTLISLVTIPLSLLVTILVLWAFSLSVNTMSIGGMAIAIGSLVDDAIVDVENVYKRLMENARLPISRRKKVRDVIFSASKEVRMPILNSTLIIVVCFFPLFFLSGLEGRMLLPLGVSFIVALFASTLVALTLTPVLCSFFFPQGSKKKPLEPSWVRSMRVVYLRLLKRAQHPRPRKAIFASTGLLVMATVILFFSLGRSFLPPFNEGSLTINISALPGISLEESDSLGQRAEKLLLEVPEVRAVARKTGRAELDEHALGVHSSELEVPLALKGRSREEVSKDIRSRLKALPGVNIEIGQPITHRIDAMLSGTQAAIAIKVFGPELSTLRTLGAEIREAVEHVDGVVDLNVEQQVERPQLLIKPRRVLLARLGITLPEFAHYVSTAIGGETVSRVAVGDQNFDLTVRMAKEDVSDMEHLKYLMINTADGRLVPLSDVADILSSSGPNAVSRENGRRKLVVSANVEGRDVRSVVNEMQEKIQNRVSFPKGYRMEFGGQFESEATASRTLFLLSLVSVVVILLLLYLQLRSFRQAAVVLLNLPLALIGGVLALVLSGGVLSIPAVIGFISLFGMATRGGMLLVDRYNALIRRGYSPQTAVLQGSLDRLLPILMTALCSALALLPLALGGDLPGNEIQSPMAKVMLGGLLTSTLLNLFIVPLIAPVYQHPKRSKCRASGFEMIPKTSQNEP